MLTCTIFLGVGIAVINGPKDLGSLWRLGLGAVSSCTLIRWQTSGGPETLAGNSFVANIAQPILSMIYFLCNGMLTAMIGEREWNQFALRRKGLRLSRGPTGSQRSTYFLQLPYRFVVPNMIFSGVLHWLVSPSIFLVAINVYRSGELRTTDPYYLQYDSEIFTCGYSPIAIMLVLILAALLVVCLIVLGRQRFRAGIPLARNCSIVLSAACHPESFDEELSQKLLQWGVTDTVEQASDASGHCAFSARTVSLPEPNHAYR